jgi:SAM-dependent methyltransferase
MDQPPLEQQVSYRIGVGLLPEQPEQAIAHLRDVLDIGCGPGGWVLDMAYTHPHLRATGIDISQGMIDYANALAHANGLDNAQFHVANAIDPLSFPDASFDLVNVRQLEAVIPAAAGLGSSRKWFVSADLAGLFASRVRSGEE